VYGGIEKALGRLSLLQKVAEENIDPLREEGVRNRREGKPLFIEKATYAWRGEERAWAIKRGIPAEEPSGL